MGSEFAIPIKRSITPIKRFAKSLEKTKTSSLRNCTHSNSKFGPTSNKSEK